MRITALDGLRGVLALIVVIDHTALFLGSVALLPFGTMAVVLFFVMSAYVLTRSWSGNYLLFLSRRFVRLWPVFAVCLAVGYWQIDTTPRWSEFVWFPILVTDMPAIWTYPDVPAWSLFIEAWAMLFMPVLIWGSRGGLPLVALVAAWAVARPFYGPLFNAIYFIFGAALHRLELPLPSLETRVPQFLGKISYSLYLSHWLVLRAVIGHLGPYGAIIALPLALLVGWGVWWSIERPSILLSRRLATRPRTRAQAPTNAGVAP